MSDHDLHDERISRLYSMGEHPAPSEHLNETIREAAHKAVSRPRLSLFWRLSATAAVLMLSIGVIFRTLETVPVEEDFLEPSSIQTGELQDAETKLKEEVIPGRPDPAAEIPEAEESAASVTGISSDEAAAIESATSREKPIKRERRAAPMLQQQAAESKQRLETPTPLPTRPSASPVTPSEKKIPIGRTLPAAPTTTLEKSLAPAPLKMKKLQPAKDQNGIFDSAAPARELMGSFKTTPQPCTGVELPTEENPQPWMELVKRLQDEDDQESLECLKRVYEIRYGKPLKTE
ncbi:MAG: hypothetical protein ABW116_05160 [Candidatus Sedimenticola sp. 20ELBAFRAG]